MNKETFIHLAPYIQKSAKPHNDDYIYLYRVMVDNYDYDYSHAIVSYMKECGCEIKRTNHNFFGGLYIYYTAPTKYIDPAVFIETYKGGIHLDSRTMAAFIFMVIPSIILIFVIVLSQYLGA